MLAVVDEGSGSAASIAGVQVAGKTGTAEATTDQVNTAFVGFAPYDTPTVAISVMIENFDEGVDEPAAATAGEVLRIALAAQGA